MEVSHWIYHVIRSIYVNLMEFTIVPLKHRNRWSLVDFEVSFAEAEEGDTGNNHGDMMAVATLGHR
jgi:hypothetical protein